MREFVYAIQEHHATHHHFDLRLEMDGVLKSWAIPKEPSLDNNVKRLAIQVEDHEIGYEGFEGEIPEGSYGAGKVKVWDKGTFQVINRKEDKIIIKINGKKLSGLYVLLRLKGKEWLFFRKKGS